MSLANSECTADGVAHGAGSGRPVRVLLVQHASDLSGSTISGSLVAAGFRDAGWHVDAALGSAGPGQSRYSELQCDIHIVPHKNWLHTNRGVQSIRRMLHEIGDSQGFLRLIRQRRPDVVYVNSLVSLAGAVAARRAGIPCIWHIRELFDNVGGEMRIPPIGGRVLVRRIVRACADRVVLISQAVCDNILGSADGRTVIVPNAADDCFFSLSATRDECRALWDLPGKQLLVGVPGTLRPMKGHEFFLDAAARVVAAGGNCHFAATGDGDPEYTERLRRRVRELGLSSRVTFLGSVVRMAEFYRACDVVCIPSRAEPFGRTVVEAFAVGTPVVATAVGGIRETVDHDVNGLLVAYGDAGALASAISRLLADSDARERLASAANAKARARYTAALYQSRIRGLVSELAKPCFSAPLGERVG